MINKLKLMLVVALGLVSFQFLAMPAVTYAGLFDDSVSDACKGAKLQDSKGTCTVGNNEVNRLDGAISTALNILSLIIGIIAVFMIVVSGLKYITSGGDSNKVSSAKSTIIYAVVGLIIVALAQVIVKFVLARTSN